MYNKLVLFFAVLLSCKIGFSEELHPMVQNSLAMLENKSITLSKAERAYHLGVVYANLSATSKKKRTTEQKLAIDQSQSFVFSPIFREFDLSEIPKPDEAIQVIYKGSTDLSDEQFCLYKGIVVGEILAGKSSGKVVYAGMAAMKRTLEVCTPLSTQINNQKEEMDNSTRWNKKDFKSSEKYETTSEVSKQ